MSSRKIGATIVLEGEKQFRNAVSNCNTSLKQMQSSMKLADAQAAAQGNSVRTLRDRHTALTQVLEAARQKQRTVADALSNARENYSRAGQNVDKYKKQLSEARTKLDEMRASGEASEEELKEQEKAVADLEEALKKSETTYEAAGNKVSKWEKDLNNATAQTLEYEAALKNLPTTMQLVGEKMETVGAKISSAGTKLTMGMTLPIVALGAAAVKTTSDFDTSMSKVSAISGATGTQFEQLRAKAREMGSETKFSASEAADAMTYMAMAGWKTEEMLDGVEGIMNLAAASGADLATTSDIVTDALTAFGLSAQDSGHFADILASASSNANTNVAMMGETFKYAAPVAGALGFSAEDTAEAIGLMANSGIKATQAGTALRTIMNQMSGAIEISGEALGDVTIETTNADGSMRSLRDILSDCRGAFSQLSESEQAQAASSIAGKNAMSGFLALMNAAPADVEKLENAIDNCDGTSQRMAETMQDNLAGQLTILKSQIQELEISFGDILVPEIRSGVSTVQKAVDWFSRLDDGTRRLVIRSGLLLAAIGPVTKATGVVTETTGKLLQTGAKVSKWIADKTIKTAADTAATVANTSATAAQTAAQTANAAAESAAAAAGAANTESTAAGAVAAEAKTVATVAETAAVGAEAVATEGATVAQWSLNAAMEANPIGIVIMAVGALAAGLVVLSAVTAKAAEDCKGLTEGLESETATVEKTRESMESAGKAMEDAFDSANQSIAKTEASSRLASNLSGELKNLASKASLTAEEQKRMTTIVSELNSLFPDWGLEIDDVTGKLNKSGDEIDDYIESMSKMTRLKAYQEAYSEAIDAVVEAEKAVIESELELDRIQGETALTTERMTEALANQVDGMVEIDGKSVNASVAMAEYRDAVSNANKESEAMTEALEEHQTAIDEAHQKVDLLVESLKEQGFTEEEIAQITGLAASETDALTASTDALGDAALSTGDDLEDYSSKAEEAYQEAYDAAEQSINSQIGLFDKLGESTQQNIDDMIAALQSQQEAMTNYNDNLSAAWEYAVSTGDQAAMDMVQSIADMGLDGAGYLDEFVRVVNEDSGKASTLIEDFAKAQNAKAEYANTMGKMKSDTVTGMSNINSAVTAADPVTARSMSNLAVNMRTQANMPLNALNNDARQKVGGSAGLAGGITASAFAVGQAASSIKSETEKMKAGNTYQWGYDQGSGFASGLRNTMSLVRSAAQTIASNVSSFLHHSTPDEGPLHGDDQWGGELAEQFAQGLIGGVSNVERAAGQIADAASGINNVDLQKSSGRITYLGADGDLQNGRNGQKDDSPIDYNKLAETMVRAFVTSGVSIKYRGREFGRVVSEVM